MADSTKLHDLLSRLQAGESPPIRDLAAAELADIIDAGRLSESEYHSVVSALVRAALAEQEPIAKESMFNALSSAATDEKMRTVNWHPIADHLEELELDCLEHALLILGLSGNAAFLPQIEPLLRHPDKDIQGDAAEALRMLGEGTAKPRLKTSRR